MRKNRLGLLALVIALVMVLSSCSSGGDSSSNTAIENTASTASGGTEKFTLWMYKSVDATYFTDYNDNVAMKYLSNKTWGDNNKTLDFEFWVPPAGTAGDNYSNMIGSGDYADIIQNTIGDSLINSYNDGVALDLTEYVNKYMPNYLAFLEKNPDLKEKAVVNIDGEDHYLSIVSFYDNAPAQYWGHLYRRDWIVRYGTNPVTGEAFTGGYTDPDDPDSWEDNVVFPSGGTDPVYISDWEWMFEIFEKAYETLGLTDSYCYSVPYNGFLAIGELTASFGGGCSGTFVRNASNEIFFGAVTSEFRAYLQCMSTWYKNGWLDPNFADRTSDMFYAIDTTSVYQGKVGMWYGLTSQVGGRMDNGSELTSGICAYPAATPINDIYGTDENKYKTPYSSYVPGKKNTDFIITTAAKNKDLATLLTFFDYLYTDEGSLLVSFGLTKEQNATVQSELMAKYNMADGAYSISDDGTIVLADAIQNNIDLYGVTGARQLPGLYREKNVDYGYKGVYKTAMNLWASFENIGYAIGDLTQYLDTNQTKKYNNINTKIGDYMSVHVPEFINGKLDPYSDTDWNNWVTMMTKYGYQKVVDILQPVADEHPYVPSTQEAE